MTAEIIPYLFYRDVPAALDWLKRAFGFSEHMRTATPSGGMHAEMLGRQLVRTGMAFGLMIFMAQFPPSFYARWAPPAFAVCIVLLLCVMVFGHIGKGAQRWLDLGFIKFQPSEFLKIIMPMTIAAYLSRHALPPTFKQVAIALMLVFIPTLQIAEQPDLGTSILVAVAGCFVIFLAGINWYLILGAMLAVGAFLPVLWFRMARRGSPLPRTSCNARASSTVTSTRRCPSMRVTGSTTTRFISARSSLSVILRYVRVLAWRVWIFGLTKPLHAQ